jgi:hypothetical protein
MNERMQELAEQAGVSSLWMSGTDQQGNPILEKFAELILNDVMSICEELGDTGQDGHYCVDAIRKKYFGVEE